MSKMLFFRVNWNLGQILITTKMWQIQFYSRLWCHRFFVGHQIPMICPFMHPKMRKVWIFQNILKSQNFLFLPPLMIFSIVFFILSHFCVLSPQIGAREYIIRICSENPDFYLNFSVFRKKMRKMLFFKG